MQIAITGRGVAVTDAISDHTTQRFTHALNQHATHVRGVQVLLKDLNGPKGGVDKTCEAVVAIDGISDVIIKKQGADLYNAISEAADGAKVAVGRAVSKLKEHR